MGSSYGFGSLYHIPIIYPYFELRYVEILKSHVVWSHLSPDKIEEVIRII